MDFAQDERTRELCTRLESFMVSHISVSYTHLTLPTKA